MKMNWMKLRVLKPEAEKMVQHFPTEVEDTSVYYGHSFSAAACKRPSFTTK